MPSLVRIARVRRLLALEALKAREEFFLSPATERPRMLH